MKIICSIVWFICSLQCLPLEKGRWESVYEPLSIQQDGITITETIAPSVKDDQLTIKLEVVMEEDRFQQQRIDEKDKEVELLSPIALRANPIRISKQEGAQRKGCLFFVLMEGVQFVPQELANTVCIQEQTLCWDVEEQMQEEESREVSISFLVQADAYDARYHSEQGHLLQMQSTFYYVKEQTPDTLRLQRLYLPSGKIRYWA